MAKSASLPHRNRASSRRLRRPLAAFAVAITLSSGLIPATLATSAAQEESAAVVEPGGGSSSWTRVVPAMHPAPVGLSESSTPTRSATSTSVALGGDFSRLQVKFREGLGVSASAGTLQDSQDGSALDEVLASFGALVARPLFDRDPAALAQDRQQAEERSGVSQPDLSSWFVLEVGGPAAGVALAGALDELDGVEMVQPEPAVAVTQGVEEDRQGYLDASPNGINAQWAWSRAGGKGENVRIVVIDSGFDTDHADLDRASAPGVAIPHEPPWDSRHGLQVLGIVAADDDGQGLRGIAHESALNTINSGRSGSDIANAIDLAGTVAGPGDVVTISQGVCAVSGCADGVVLPLVYSSSARDALRVAAARGIITVVSGGNGGANLDAYDSRLGSDSPETIVVGAGNGAAATGCSSQDGPSRGRVATSNYGSRVDVQGWGSCVRTARQGGGYQWWGFTSGATPVVAGAAGLLSSIAEQRRGINLGGGQIRSLFEATGAAQTFGGTRGGSIGPLPNVRAAAAALSQIPGHDFFDRAVDASALPYRDSVDTRFAGVEIDEPALRCGSVSNTVWYSLKVPVDTRVTISTQGSDFDTVLGLWRRTSSGLRRSGCSDDVTVNNPTSEITRTLTGGSTYFIQVGSASGRGGSLDLVIGDPGFDGVGCDIDGDGLGDLVSGSPDEGLAGRAQAGRALIHFGRVGAKPNRVTSVTQAWPSVPGNSESNDRFGHAVACGDFDGDGFDDLAVGTPGEGTAAKPRAGAISVIPGSARGLAVSGAITIQQSNKRVVGKAGRGDGFGSALTVGDFDGDGTDDLAVGIEGKDRFGLADVGAVVILYGQAGGLSRLGSQLLVEGVGGLSGTAEAGDQFGSALAGSDLDRDGFDDLVVGIPGEDVGAHVDAGAVVVLAGGPAGVSPTGGIRLHQNIDGVADSPGTGDLFGYSLAVGDLNGDRFADLAVGAPGDEVSGHVGAGRVHIFQGAAVGIAGPGSTAFHQDTPGVRDVAGPGDLFGASLSIADLSGDGFDELSVGVPGEQVAGLGSAGQVHVFDGSAAGVSVESDQIVNERSKLIPGRVGADDRLGEAITAVDLDGDTRWDLVAGIPGQDWRTKADVGAILLVPGGLDGVRRGGSTLLTQRSPRAGLNERGDALGASLAPR